MKELMNLIDGIQNEIFNYSLKKSADNIILLTEKIEKNITNFELEDIKKILTVLQYMNFYFANKDYLTYCDLLEYELKPILINYIN